MSWLGHLQLVINHQSALPKQQKHYCSAPYAKPKKSTVTPASGIRTLHDIPRVTQQQTCISKRYTVTDAYHSASPHRVSPPTSFHGPTACLPEPVVPRILGASAEKHCQQVQASYTPTNALRENWRPATAYRSLLFCRALRFHSLLSTSGVSKHTVSLSRSWKQGTLAFPNLCSIVWSI